LYVLVYLTKDYDYSRNSTNLSLDGPLFEFISRTVQDFKIELLMGKHHHKHIRGSSVDSGEVDPLTRLKASCAVNQITGELETTLRR